MSPLSPERLPVYLALDDLPTPVFAALLMAMSGVSRVMAATVLDDPTPVETLDAAAAPFIAQLGEAP